MGDVYNTIGGGMHITSFVSSRRDDIAFLQAVNHNINNNNSSDSRTDTNKRKCGQLRTTSHRRRHHHHQRNTKKRRKMINLSKNNDKGDVAIVGCRRYRRRRCHLLQQYSVGTSNSCCVVKWLNTHIWHTKRMTMKNMWGYRIPTRSSQHSFSNEILKKGAIVSDRSFIRPIQVSTIDMDDMRAILVRFLDPSSIFLSSKNEAKEFETLIYSDGNFPHKCMGPITITYCHTSANENSINVWIWAHPAFFSSLKDELSIALHQISQTGNIIEVNDLVRFSTRGISSSSIIKKVIDPCISLSNETLSHNEQFFSKIIDSEALHRLWVDGNILAVECKDSKCFSMKADQDPPCSNSFKYRRNSPQLRWPSAMQSTASSLWNFDSRKMLTDSFVTGAKSDYNKTFPVLLVRKRILNNSKLFDWNKNIYDGWDIIAPACFASFLWSKIHYTGAKAIGVYDFNDLQTNSGIATFPRDFDAISSINAAENTQKSHTNQDVTVVREKRYLTPFDPSKSSLKSKLQVAKIGQNELLITVRVPRLPMLPTNTFITVRIVPTSRGIPREGAQIFGLSSSDFILWSALELCKGQITLGSHVKSWRGYNSTQLIERIMINIGVVSSGQQRATRNSRVGIGLCNAVTLRDYFRLSMQAWTAETMALSPSRSCCLVMFQNQSSHWMRPALLEIIPVSE